MINIDYTELSRNSVVGLHVLPVLYIKVQRCYAKGRVNSFCRHLVESLENAAALQEKNKFKLVLTMNQCLTGQIRKYKRQYPARGPEFGQGCFRLEGKKNRKIHAHIGEHDLTL